MFPYDWMEQMQATQETALPELVAVERRVLTDDGFGGANDQARTVVGTNRPARITQAQMQNMGGQMSRQLLIEKWTIRMEWDEDLEEEDFIVWGAVTLQIEDIKPRSYQTALTAMAEVVK